MWHTVSLYMQRLRQWRLPVYSAYQIDLNAVLGNRYHVPVLSLAAVIFLSLLGFRMTRLLPGVTA